MTDLNETEVWEDGVYQIRRGDEVSGGRDGVANIQSQQLANRTQWLKKQLELTQSLVNVKPYPTVEQGMSATSEGEYFCQFIAGTPPEIKYYQHVGNSAVLVGESFNWRQLENLMGLSDAARYFDANAVGGEYELCAPVDIAIIDSKFNIICYVTDGVYYFSNGVSTITTKTEKLIVDGVEITPESLPPMGMSRYLSDDLFNAGGEFELNGGYDTLLLSENNMIIESLKDGKYASPIKRELSDVSIKRLFFDEKQIDLNNVPSSEVIDNINAMSKASVYLSPDEFELNPKKWVIVDEQMMIVFDVENIESNGTDDNEEKEIIAYTRLKDGVSQVFAFDEESSTETRITNNNSNEVSPRVSGRRIFWLSDRQNASPAGYYSDPPYTEEYAVVSTDVLCVWGDSFIENPKFASTLHALTGLPTYNFGKSSLRSTAVAARQGGTPAYYMPVNGVIPAEASPVALTPNVPGPADRFDNSSQMTINNVVLAGIDGSFTWDGTQATFLRAASGSEVLVSEPVPLVVRPFTTANVENSTPAGVEYPLHRDAINIFWMGRNNSTQTDTIIANAVSMVESIKTLGKKIVILPVFNSGGESKGTAGYNNIIAVNAALKKTFPEYYCEFDGIDLRQYFINHGNPDFSTDAENMQNDVPPYSLRYDALHPSQGLTGNGASQAPEYALYVGAEVNAEGVVKFIKQVKGWI